MSSDAKPQFTATSDQDKIRDLRQLAALYIAGAFLNLALGLVLGDPLSSFLDWFGRFGQVAAILAVLALVIAFKMNAFGRAALVCRLIAGGDIAYGVAYGGLYEGMLLGYAEVGWQLLIALIFLAVGLSVEMNVSERHRSWGCTCFQARKCTIRTRGRATKSAGALREGAKE